MNQNCGQFSISFDIVRNTRENSKVTQKCYKRGKSLCNQCLTKSEKPVPKTEKENSNEINPLPEVRNCLPKSKRKVMQIAQKLGRMQLNAAGMETAFIKGAQMRTN